VVAVSLAARSAVSSAPVEDALNDERPGLERDEHPVVSNAEPKSGRIRALQPAIRMLTSPRAKAAIAGSIGSLQLYAKMAYNWALTSTAGEDEWHEPDS